MEEHEQERILKTMDLLEELVPGAKVEFFSGRYSARRRTMDEAIGFGELVKALSESGHLETSDPDPVATAMNKVVAGQDTETELASIRAALPDHRAVFEHGRYLIYPPSGGE